MDKLYDESSTKPVVQTESASEIPVIVPDAAPEKTIENPTNMEMVSLDSAFNVAPVLDSPQPTEETIEELDNIEMHVKKGETQVVTYQVEIEPEMPISALPN